MKKIFVCLAVSGLVFGLNYKAITSSSQPPAAHTGAPGDSNCATSGCHTGNLNTGTGSVVLLNVPFSYVPGTVYNLQVQVTQSNKTRFGFELVALNSNNQQAGTLILTNTANTASQTLGGKTYVSHKNASANNIWSFNWQAPATNVGNVIFYFAGNAANGDGNTTGDNIYTSTKVVNQPGTTVGVKEENPDAVPFFPNPASTNLNLNLTEKAKVLKVLDLSGREVFRGNQVANKSQLDVRNFPNGTYFLQVEEEKTIQMKRFVVQH